MKGNTRQEILQAWDNGQELFWFWDDDEGLDVVQKDLGYIATAFFETESGIVFNYCSIEDPRPKKKTRKMTPLEMAWKAGHKIVFSGELGSEWWYTYIDSGDTSTHYAEILDEGKRLGPWKPLEVEE
jgi:hypothetical protein